MNKSTSKVKTDSKPYNALILLRIAAFISLFFVLLNALSLVFVPKYKNGPNGMVGYIAKSYKGEPKNTLDAFIVGNSDAYRAFSPMQLWGKSGLTSCVSGKGKQDPEGAYDILENMYKYQSPKVVIVETDMFYEPLPKAQNNGYPKFINKLIDFKAFLRDGFKDFDDAATSGISYYFPIVKYHERWNKLKLHDITNTKASYSFDYKGFIPDFTTKAYEGGFDYMGTNDGTEERVSRSKIHYLNKIVKLCEKNGSEIVLVEAPSAVSWNYKRHNAVQNLSQKYSIDFIDMNIEGTINDFNWLTDTKDGGDHLNISGAQKASDYLNDYLKRYNFTDKRENSDFAAWNSSYEKYIDELN